MSKKPPKKALEEAVALDYADPVTIEVGGDTLHDIG